MVHYYLILNEEQFKIMNLIDNVNKQQVVEAKLGTQWKPFSNCKYWILPNKQS